MRADVYPALRRALITLLVLAAMAAATVATVGAQDDCQPLITIDQPTANASVRGSITVAGWAVDQTRASGSTSGVQSVQVYRDGQVDAGGVLVGMATMIARPDVDAALGLSGARAGWSLATDGASLSPGAHTLYVYALTACGWASHSVAITVEAGSSAQINVDSPTGGQSVASGQQLIIGGWAADVGPGAGIDQIQVLADGPIGTGTVLGNATIGKPRPDVAAATGKPEWTNSGFDLVWRVGGLTPGPHTLYIYARSAATGEWSYKTVTITVTGTGGGGGSRASGGLVEIQSPSAGATTRESVIMRGVAADCSTGETPTRIRVYSGSASGSLLGDARPLSSSRTLASVCGSGTGSGNYAWEFNLNTRSLAEGNRTITVVAEFSSGNATDSVSINVDNYVGTGSVGGGYDPFYGGYGGYGGCGPDYVYTSAGCTYVGSGVGSGYCGPGYVYLNGSCTYTGANCGYGYGSYPYYGSYGTNCGYCPGGYSYISGQCNFGGYGNCPAGYVYNPNTGLCTPTGGGYGTCASGVIVLDQAFSTVPVSQSVTLSGYALTSTGFGTAQPATTVTIVDRGTAGNQQTIPVNALNLPRTDAQQLYGATALNSGFTANWNTSGLGQSYFSRVIEVTASSPSCGSFTRTFTVNVSPTGGTSNSVISIGNGDAFEGQVGANNVIFTVTLTPAALTQVTVNYTTVNGTAVAGQDFQPASGTVTFMPGETLRNITVLTIADTVVEPDETFTLQLSNPVGATLSGTASVGIGTIKNDD